MYKSCAVLSEENMTQIVRPQTDNQMRKVPLQVDFLN